MALAQLRLSLDDLCPDNTAYLPRIPKLPGYLFDLIADCFGHLYVLLDFFDRSQLKLLVVVGHTVTKLTPIPGTIPSCPNQQRITSAFARRSDSTNFKGICAQFLHITSLTPSTIREVSLVIQCLLPPSLRLSRRLLLCIMEGHYPIT